jgi:hypothetical protein
MDVFEVEFNAKFRAKKTRLARDPGVKFNMGV